MKAKLKSKHDGYEIEQSVPPPKKRNNYPLKIMEVGDSFLESDPELIQLVRGIVYQHGHRNGKRFSTKTEDGGIRVWRVE